MRSFTCETHRKDNKNRLDAEHQDALGGGTRELDSLQMFARNMSSSFPYLWRARTSLTRGRWLEAYINLATSPTPVASSTTLNQKKSISCLSRDGRTARLTPWLWFIASSVLSTPARTPWLELPLSVGFHWNLFFSNVIGQCNEARDANCCFNAESRRVARTTSWAFMTVNAESKLSGGTRWKMSKRNDDLFALAIAR